MDIKQALVKIVGKANVLDSPKTIERYGRDHSLLEPGLFTCVVRPATPDEVQQIIALANKEKFAVVPQTSGTHFNGAAVPREGGIVLDLSRMTKITDIVGESNTANIQVGVTWEKYQAALEKEGYFSVMPLLPPADRSVITDWLEYEQPTIHSNEFAGPLRSMQMVWGTGELFVSGSAGVDNFRNPGVLNDGVLASGPGPMSWDTFLYGAQGTLGLVTWATNYVEDLPVAARTFFIPTQTLEDAVDPMYKVLRLGVGYECFQVNRLVLATILAEKPADIDRLRAILPPWTVILVLRALKRRPEEKLAYEEDAVREVMTKFFTRLDLLKSLPGLPGVERRLPDMLRKPWPAYKTYWKHALKGGCQDITFITTMERAGAFLPVAGAVAGKFGYPASEMGVYLQPLENGRACQLQLSFYYNPEDKDEVARLRGLYPAVVAALLEAGAYFNRPYPMISDLIYQKYGNYPEVLKRFKKHYDPNGILNPGRLCY